VVSAPRRPPHAAPPPTLLPLSLTVVAIAGGFIFLLAPTRLGRGGRLGGAARGGARRGRLEPLGVAVGEASRLRMKEMGATWSALAPMGPAPPPPPAAAPPAAAPPPTPSLQLRPCRSRPGPGTAAWPWAWWVGRGEMGSGAVRRARCLAAPRFRLFCKCALPSPAVDPSPTRRLLSGGAARAPVLPLGGVDQPSRPPLDRSRIADKAAILASASSKRSRWAVA